MFDYTDDRKLNIYHPIGYTNHDSIFITVPDGYETEYLPKTTKMESTYGSYNLIIEQTDNIIKVSRTLQINSGTYSPEEFDKINTFLGSIVKSDHSMIVFSKKSR